MTNNEIISLAGGRHLYGVLGGYDMLSRFAGQLAGAQSSRDRLLHQTPMNHYVEFGSGIGPVRIIFHGGSTLNPTSSCQS